MGIPANLILFTSYVYSYANLKICTMYTHNPYTCTFITNIYTYTCQFRRVRIATPLSSRIFVYDICMNSQSFIVHLHISISRSASYMLICEHTCQSRRVRIAIPLSRYSSPFPGELMTFTACTHTHTTHTHTSVSTHCTHAPHSHRRRTRKRPAPAHTHTHIYDHTLNTRTAHTPHTYTHTDDFCNTHDFYTHGTGTHTPRSHTPRVHRHLMHTTHIWIQTTRTRHTYTHTPRCVVTVVCDHKGIEPPLFAGSIASEQTTRKRQKYKHTPCSVVTVVCDHRCVAHPLFAGSSRLQLISDESRYSSCIFIYAHTHARTHTHIHIRTHLWWHTARI